MVNIYADLQRKLLVVGLQNPRALVPFPNIFAGESLDLTLWGLVPSGDPAAPYAALTLTAATLSLCVLLAGVSTAVVTTSEFAVSDGQLTGVLAVPPTVAFPAGQRYAAARLALDLVTADGAATHVEAACALWQPALPIVTPVPYDPTRNTLLTLDGSVLTTFTGAPFLFQEAA